MVAGILERTGPGWPVPDVSTPGRRRKTLAVRISSRRAPGALNLPADNEAQAPLVRAPRQMGSRSGTESGWPERTARIAGAGVRKVHPAMDTATGGYPGGGVHREP